MCLRSLESLCYRAQAEKCMVIDKAEIVKHQITVHSVCLTATGHNAVLALPGGSLSKP